jgi:adenylyltransferase/sulfurtransferase
VLTVEERYSRQAVFQGIGAAGQEKIGNSRVAIIGLGALGTVIANNLARAGVGYMRLIDRDFVELSNLQRQTIFDEEDVRENLPKAVAAVRHLEKVNSTITLEAVVSDVNSSNIETLLADIDLVMDGTDNFETRFLLNDACLKKNIPWVHGAVLGSYGLTANIIPGKTSCYRCFMPEMPKIGAGGTCSSAGVLNMITGIISCYASAEALKIMVGSPDIRKSVIFIDVWNNSFNSMDLPVNSNCPACAKKEYQYLSSRKGTYTTVLCGQKAVQIVPGQARKMDFADIVERLAHLGEIEYNSFLLRLKIGEVEITLFADGRAIIKNIENENKAKALYTEYFGL